jgi:threonine dehydrogenase-like Zn-dependent dehydrogenase
VGATFGHEFTGIVEEVGSSVQNLKVGDHVMVPFTISCGSCYFCRKSQFSNCHTTNPNSTVGTGLFGYSHTTGGYDGGQAEYVRVPFADVGPFIIPEWLHEEDALLLTDVAPTGYQAAEMGEIKEGDTVVVFGAGPVGLMAAKSAWLMGAGRVIVVDHVQYRLDFAQKWCPAEVINFTEFDDIVTHIKKVTDFRGADVCIDAVGAEAVGNKLDHITGVKLMLQAGSPTALDWCINSVRKNGIVSIVGVYGPTMNAIPIGSAMNKGITMRMNQSSPKRYIPHLMEHIKNGYLSPKDIITHRVPLEEVPDAYEMFANKRDNCIKTILVPPKANLGSSLNPRTLH